MRYIYTYACEMKQLNEKDSQGVRVFVILLVYPRSERVHLIWLMHSVGTRIHFTQLMHQ